MCGQSVWPLGAKRPILSGTSRSEFTVLQQSAVTKDDQALKIFGWASGAASMRAAYYGLKLGLLVAISASPAGLTADELSATTGVDPRYLPALAKSAGAGLVALARTFPLCSVTGLDPDPTSIALAKQRIDSTDLADRVHAEEMRAEDLTSEDAFDFIYAQISLHEMDDARVALASARRALKEEGTLLITEIRGPERIEDAVGPYNAALAHIDLFYEIPQAIVKDGHAVGLF